MEQIETLRERASIIRSLAQSFDQPVVRADLLLLAMRCEEMAEEAESEITERRASEQECVSSCLITASGMTTRAEGMSG